MTFPVYVLSEVFCLASPFSEDVIMLSQLIKKQIKLQT